MNYDMQAQAEIQRVAPQLLPLYNFLLVEHHVSPFVQGNGNPRHALKDLKEALLSAGVRPAYWRFLCQLEPWLVRLLTTKSGVLLYWSMQINRNLALLINARVLPTCPRVAELILNAAAIFPEGKHLKSYTALAGVAFAEGRRRKEVGEDAARFAEEVRYTLMWVGSVFLAHHHMPAKKKWKAGWEVIYRGAAEYLVMYNEFPQYFNNYHWRSLLPPFHYLGLDVVPIESSRDLMEEAAAMCHCVYASAPRCREGLSRIFSLRKDGDWLATFEIALRDGRWRLVQVRGECNARPRSALLCIYVARKAARRYNLIWARVVSQFESAHSGRCGMGSDQRVA